MKMCKLIFVILLMMGFHKENRAQSNDTIPAYYQARMIMSDEEVAATEVTGRLEMDVFVNDANIQKLHIKLSSTKNGDIMLNQIFNCVGSNENLPSGVTFEKSGNKCSIVFGTYPFIYTAIEVTTENTSGEISSPIYEIY